MHSRFRLRSKTVVAVLVMGVVALAALAGCTRTITVTAKGRNILGWYYVCDGTTSWLNPCRKGHEWRVSQQLYNAAQVGHTYTIHG